MEKSLLDVLRDVALDPGEQAAFSADPSAYLARYGYEDVQAEDLNEAFSLVADTLPPDVAQAVSPTGSGSFLSAGEGFGAEAPMPDPASSVVPDAVAGGDADPGAGADPLFGQGEVVYDLDEVTVDDAAPAFGEGSGEAFGDDFDDATQTFGGAADGAPETIDEGELVVEAGFELSATVEEAETLDQADAFEDVDDGNPFDDSFDEGPSGFGDVDDIGSF